MIIKSILSRRHSNMLHLTIFFFCMMLAALAIVPTSSVQAKNNRSHFGVINEKRIDRLIASMTVEEKCAMLHMNSMFSSTGVERLGIPELRCTDGPFGVREELERNSWNPLHLTTDSATFFPTGSALAATWNPARAYQYGVALGEETRARGKQVILGPAVNITRTPINGRTFEYMSEDPYLNSRLVVGYITGVQSTGTASCVKHFAVNNQESNREAIDVRVDERALREIYLPAFKAAVREADVRCIMSAYNKMRGRYCGENGYLLDTIAKGEWGFKGLVMSDWAGTHSTVPAVLNGLDVEMGTDKYFTRPLLDSVKAGVVPMSVIDEKVRRILRVMLSVPRMKSVPAGGTIATAAHAKTAYQIASESIVLLKNSAKLLPLSAKTIKTIAVIGDNATRLNQSGGFGAGVKARLEVTPLAGLKNRAGKSISIVFAQGYESKFGVRGKKMHSVDTLNRQLVDEAVAAAQKADVAIIIAGNNRQVETEATDRTTLTLPFGQDELIEAVTAANPHTVVVVAAGAPVDLRTITRSASAVLYSWFNGSEGGNALADVLFGTVNPSGKLPFTFPATLDDSPAHMLKTFPGDSVTSYAEGILVGYRWFDTKQIAPVYCFGHGLSYTDFKYSNLKTNKQTYAAGEKIRVSLKLKNTGAMTGSEVVQIYVSDMDPKIFKAAQELKAFKKISVPRGTTANVDLDINASDLAYYDTAQMKWVVSPGKYRIQAGSSSRDIRDSVVITLN
ncbi:MAG TPA: glycoside hydrolase family 3 C-terminal domain-containing protein [Bacteroidota bacterium]|nr:glycoside hydrolase family 3 C-terminal domain-containing protein [Bacteroidota bacterium]